MLRSLLIRHHRLAFFLGFHLAYVAVLFGVAGAHDPAHAPRSLVRLLAPAVELGLAALLCAGCLRMARRGARLPWMLLSGAIALAVAIVYLAQGYSLYLSHNFISVLAMQNADSVAFVESPLLLAGIVAAVSWTALFWAASWIASGSGPEKQGAAVRWGWRRYAATTAACGVLAAYLLFVQGSGLRLEPGFRQSPAANLAVNLHRLQYAAPIDVATTAAPSTGAACFDFRQDPVASEYPFLRDEAYRAPLPFPRRPTAPDGPPNLIVVFAEGISARMVGAYGGRYPGLTPNLDRLAARSMRVDDYFNHTAATFRGLGGQLSSGFSYAGGGGKEGWTKVENQAALMRIRRQALPRLVGAAGYDSHFFVPHRRERPLVRMLHSLGFSKVHTYQSIGRELLHGRFGVRPDTGALDDQSLFRGIVAYLEQRADTGNRQPFFLATYNIGTHAFLSRSSGDVAYRDHGNPVLDRLHNFDEALGEFLRYFFDSPYAGNTILVVTADHSTYPEPPFREVAGKDLKPYFVDRIPLLVHDPFHRLPGSLDARGRNSLDLAPTVLQLAGLPAGGNGFLGTSLFEPRNFPVGIAAIASNYYMTVPEGVFGMDEIPDAYRDTFNCEVNVVRRFYAAERDNRIVPAMAVPEPQPGIAGDEAGRTQAGSR